MKRLPKAQVPRNVLLWSAPLVVLLLFFAACGEAMTPVGPEMNARSDPSVVAKRPDKVTICNKPGTPAEKTMQVSQTAVPGHLGHGDVIGGCLTGVDTFPSGGSITLLPPIVPNPEIVTLSSAGFPDAIITRQQQSGDVIETEMVSLELTGTSIGGIPVRVRVGSNCGLPASTGKIINVDRDPDGGFGSGDSFFDVFFEIEVGGNVARNDEAVRLEARNRDTKESAPITSRPPNDPADPDNTEWIEYAEDVLGQTGLPITDPIHIPFAEDPDSVCARVPGANS